MRKLFLILIILSLTLIDCGPLGLFFQKEPNSPMIGLVPLDSRPANTQYPETLGGLAGFKVIIPYPYLDNFLTPADTDGIWEWLEKETLNFDTLIINTSVLFNGSLIETRHPNSYENLDMKLEKLKQYCMRNTDLEIVVITVLPRLLPSQFTELWRYKDYLLDYAISLDKADLQRLDMPPLPAGVPVEVLREYLSIYQQAQLMTETLIDFTNQGLIDHLLIGQDDAEKFGLSNKIVRDIEESFNENIIFVHGADELTMLALTRNKLDIPEQGIDLVYSNSALVNKVFPFEADTLEKILEAKLDYLGLTVNAHSPFLQIIHTDVNYASRVNTLMQESKHQYIGIHDIALTNRGDIALMEPLFAENITGYSGWNTASNTIGTELSHFVSLQHFLKSQLTEAQKIKGLEAYVKFKYIRFAEDFVYQAILRSDLNESLISKGMDPNNLGMKKAGAEDILKSLYEPYERQLNEMFLREHSLGEHLFTVESINSEITLPWARTFEAKINVEVKLSVN